MARHTLDARRLLCPLPVIRTQNAMKNLAPGDVLEVTATCDVTGTVVLSAEQKNRSRNVGLTMVVLGIVSGSIFTNRPLVELSSSVLPV